MERTDPRRSPSRGRRQGAAKGTPQVDRFKANTHRHGLRSTSAGIAEVLLVIRKMVRGLCHHHKLGTQVADHQVLAMQFENSPPEGATATVFNDVPGVFRYSHFHEHFMEDMIHSSWLLTFYERVSFIGSSSNTG